MAPGESTYDESYALTQAREIPKEYQNAITRLIHPKLTDKILELGSGSGSMLTFLQQSVDHVFGIDVSLSALINAHKKNTAQATANILPFPAESMNVCVSFHVLEHTVGQSRDKLVPDLHAVFTEVARVTKDGGLSLHVFPQPWVNRREGALIDTLREANLPTKELAEYPEAIKQAWDKAGQLHPHVLKPEVIKEALNGTPWKIKQFTSIFVPSEFGVSRMLLLQKGTMNL
jgi:ubiquinone/menaquinone biosynthesis C-methylase UbiE